VRFVITKTLLATEREQL